MASMRVRLTFPTNLVTEPIIYSVGTKFDIVTNIRRANISKDTGWVVLEITGDDAILQNAVEYLQQTGVSVEPIIGDVLES